MKEFLSKGSVIEATQVTFHDAKLSLDRTDGPTSVEKWTGGYFGGGSLVHVSEKRMNITNPDGKVIQVKIDDWCVKFRDGFFYAIPAQLFRRLYYEESPE